MVTTGESSPLNSQAGCATGGQAAASSDKDVAPLLTSVFKESLVETQTQTRLPNDTSQRAVSFSESGLPKAASNDLTPIFGGSSAPGGELQEIEVEPQGRRMVRFEPARKSQECAAEALEERNEHNLQAEKEPGEKHGERNEHNLQAQKELAENEHDLQAQKELAENEAKEQNRVEVGMLDKEKLEFVFPKMADVRDASLDARLELAELKFELEEILRVQYMERCWMEVKILWDDAAITGRDSPSAPHFNGCPPVLRNNLRMRELSYMMNTYDRVRALPNVNSHLRSVLNEIGPNGLSSLASERLKRKWTLQEEELRSCEAKRAKFADDLDKDKRFPVPPLEVGDSDLLDDEDDDGKLCDLKRLDKEILGRTDYKIEWKKAFRESYKWYYPYAEVSSREEYLKKVVDCLAKRAEARGASASTENEVIGYMLLDIFATFSLSPSVSNAPFPPSSPSP